MDSQDNGGYRLGAPEFVGKLTPREDLTVPESKVDSTLAPDSDGYFSTGVKDDDPMLGKGDEHFAFLVGRLWTKELEDEAYRAGAKSIRVIEFQRGEHMDRRMGRLHVYLGEDNTTVRHIHFERLYTKWRIGPGPGKFIRNSEAISRLSFEGE